ncbi:hypothetical protein C8T65DRAFT_44477 [Cerioporus squamosus]|nr:hypothetical protein C8T65DRAFT_44477 [Cerioporus squamosus]
MRPRRRLSVRFESCCRDLSLCCHPRPVARFLHSACPPCQPMTAVPRFFCPCPPLLAHAYIASRLLPPPSAHLFSFLSAPAYPHSMSLCPPPRMPSPQLVPAPLPSPPVFPRRISSRSRLHLPSHPGEPPIPPRLVGSPLLERLIHQDPATLTPKIQKQLWFDGDEFGTQSASPALSDASTVTVASRARSHSPPPPQQLSASIPPVPPIPSSAFDSPGARRPVLRTPPATPGRSRPMQIIIPDLTNSPSTTAGCPSPALRHTPRTSRTSTSASPSRRRGLGTESH